MKKFILIFGIMIAAIGFTACNREPDFRMLENASPETSAMALYCFDGENTNVKWLFDKEEEKRIIAEVNELKTKSVPESTAADIKIPCYGINICDKEGYEIWLTYSDGLWLLKDGSMYKAEYDLKSLYDDTPETHTDSFKGGIYMLNAGIMKEYDMAYYEKADDFVNIRSDITMTVTKVEGNTVYIKLENNSDDDFSYSESFSLQKEIDGSWYRMPDRLSNYGFNSILIRLPAHESVEQKCDITKFGELGKGHYRIEKEGLLADFYIR